MSQRPCVLLLSGSVRAKSSNRLLLDGGASLAPSTLNVRVGPSPAALPHFDPDLDSEGKLPTDVQAFRESVGRSAALVISCPEYAHGIPGSFKNMLDWLVGSESFGGTLVALWSASPRSRHVGPQLREVLATMAARIVEPACVTVALGAHRSSIAELASNTDACNAIEGAWIELERAIQTSVSVSA